MEIPSYIASNDLQFVHQDFVTLNTVPTHVLTCGRWLSEPLPDNNKLLIIFIPGNPGAIDYYEEFLKSLYEGLQRAIPIWGVAHAGHTVTPVALPLPKLQGNEDLYLLEGQITHKIAFISKFVPRDRELIFIGHSIGCYIALELMKRLHHQFKIIKSYLLFPTIERMAITPQAQWVWPLLTYLRLPTLLGVYALSCLSSQLQSKIVSWYFKDRTVPECILKGSMHLFHPDCTRLCLMMARDEFEHVKELDTDNLYRNLDKVTLYYGAADRWCPLSYYQEMKERFPKGDIRLCRNNFEHAFLLENSKEVGAMVAGWILVELLGSSRDVHAKSLLV